MLIDPTTLDVRAFLPADRQHARDRTQGLHLSKDREGNLKQFPLLTCSAALVEIPAGPRNVNADQLASKIADLKKAAKRAPSHLSVSSLS